MSESRSGRVDIVPQGEFHFEMRVFEGERDKRYRSWSLPFAAAEAITRWWLRPSLPLGEISIGSESSVDLKVEADTIASASMREVNGISDILPRYQGTPIIQGAIREKAALRDVMIPIDRRVETVF